MTANTDTQKSTTEHLAVISSIRSRTEDHLHHIASIRSEIREIDPSQAHNDVELLAQIGYKQELRRHYSTLQVFGIAYSIMGLLPSISSTIATGLESGPAGLVWGWFIASIFILSTGTSMSFLGSAIPTSGGLYYYTNYYSPHWLRVPLSFLIGCSNTLGLIGGLCSISYGFAVEVLSAVFIQADGDFEITNAKCYGIFAACIISNVVISCLTTKYAAHWQTLSIIVNTFLIVLFLIAVPVGKKSDFNSASYIFTNFENARTTYSAGWSFFMGFMPAVWTIGAFDSAIHCSEEAKNAQRAIPVGIVGSITACWILGWIICIVCAACIKDGDTARVLSSATGNPMAQIIYDALGKQWAVAFMAMIAVGQYMMSVSILIALSRQIWSFARDNGLPIVYNFVKVINPKIQVPVRATIFAGCLSLVIGMLVLINGTAGAGALFSLAVACNLLAWGTPVFLVLLPLGRKRFVSGPFYFGVRISTFINCVTSCWVVFIIVLAMFPDSRDVDKNTMNYTVVINCGMWILSLIYFYVWGYRSYTGPVTNLDDEYSEGSSVRQLDEVLTEKA
ncbi:GABA-specific permease [Spathaspora sp. JA1]|nr:GABA-specific permease [Spathaspora sp. JA1]